MNNAPHVPLADAQLTTTWQTTNNTWQLARDVEHADYSALLQVNTDTEAPLSMVVQQFASRKCTLNVSHVLDGGIIAGCI